MKLLPQITKCLADGDVNIRLLDGIDVGWLVVVFLKKPVMNFIFFWGVRLTSHDYWRLCF